MGNSASVPSRIFDIQVGERVELQCVASKDNITLGCLVTTVAKAQLVAGPYGMLHAGLSILVLLMMSRL